MNFLVWVVGQILLSVFRLVFATSLINMLHILLGYTTFCCYCTTDFFRWFGKPSKFLFGNNRDFIAICVDTAYCLLPLYKAVELETYVYSLFSKSLAPQIIRKQHAVAAGFVLHNF